jgi:A/G-specific adenine glycosylase
MSSSGNDFASVVIRWQRDHGRHDLPWQQTRDPYLVWLSEIMLQQTQVGTVKAYYARFLERFPDMDALAAADLDEVLSVWSGLGYYSRARNLHRCAQAVRDRFGGKWPRSPDVLETLPGIGRSTAAAIAAFCFGERVAILDGNVRRVLSRVLGFDSDLSKMANQRALWVLAEQLLPVDHLRQTMPAYTQGLMDIGATVCRARGPDCGACPVASVCVARRAEIRTPILSGAEGCPEVRSLSGCFGRFEPMVRYGLSDDRRLASGPDCIAFRCSRHGMRWRRLSRLLNLRPSNACLLWRMR